MKAYFLLALLLLGCTHITIDPATQRCNTDTDCISVHTECDVCQCVGQPVNRQYADYYNNELKNLCHGIVSCKGNPTCTNAIAKCVHEECMIMPSSLARARS